MMNRYFLTVDNRPVNLTEAKEINHAMYSARVKHMGDGFCIESDMDKDQINWFFWATGRKYEARSAETVHIIGTFRREDANEVIQMVKRWGGCVNYAAEAFENIYLDMDVLRGPISFACKIRALNIEKVEY